MNALCAPFTAVQLGLASYDPDRVQGAVLDRAELDRQIDLYRSRDAEARRGIVGLQPKRAEVILAGACIVRTHHGQAGPADPDGERPGPASRVAGSPVRHLIPAGRPEARPGCWRASTGDCR
jgi:hypothetical protein